MMRLSSTDPSSKTGQPRAGFLRFLGIGLLFIFVLGSAHFSVAQVVLQSDFEDGTTGGWGSFCGAVVTNTTAAAESGTHALLASGRTQGCAGPSILLTNTLIPLATYQITGWVRLPDSESGNIDQADFTVDQTDASSGNNFVTVGPFQTQVTNTGWVELSGQYTVTASPTSTILYAQLVNSGTGLTDSFYLDNVTVTEISGPPTGPQDNSGISTDFEDGFLDGWAPRFGSAAANDPTATGGCCTLTNTTADAHGGTHSVLVTGRTGAFEGPQINVSNKMFVGSTYAVSVWVKLGPTATAADTLRVSLQTSLGGTLSFGTVVGNTTIPLNTWVNLKIPKYSMGSSYDPGTAFLYVESNSGTQDFYIDDFSLTFIPPVQIEQNIASVFQTYANLFPIGTAIDSSDIAGPHSQLWVKHFNSMTSGNDMKWDATEPQENNFTYTTADAQVAFAQKNNIRVRGHNLVWANGSQVPAWVFLEEDGVTPLTPGNAADKALLISRIQNHIQNVVTHFGTATYAWDVVNEPIDATQTDCLVHGPFYNIIGPTYIDIAFQAARAANPNAELFLNDFNTTTDPKKTCLFNVVQGMIARGVPIDAVGHEMHINLQFPPVQSLADTVNQLRTLTTITGKPLDQQVTEFDISVYFGSNPTIFTDYSQIPQDFFVQQGYLYRDFFQVLKQLNSDPANPKISSVTFWGMADDDTWLDSATKIDGPLLFDTGLQHKLAYTGIIDPLDLPGADLSVTQSAAAGSVLSGQSVAYTVTVTNNGNLDAASLTLTDTLPGSGTFQSIGAPAGWTCTTPAVGSSGNVSCTAAALTNGSTAQFTLMVGVPCGAMNGATLTNTVNIASTTRDPNPDPSNNTSTLNVSVSNPAPVISGLTVHPNVLWPPDTLLHPVTLSYSVSGNCTAGIVPVITVVSNQPVDPHRPRIIPMTDWVVVDAHHVLLRAIIDPLNLKGRIYTITLTATDAGNASSSSSATVNVPLLPPFLF